MNSLFDPEEFIFLSYEQESCWKKKWLKQKIGILETKLKQLNDYMSKHANKRDEESMECCSRTKPPPSSCMSQCVNLCPIYQQYSNPSKLVNSSYAPITPIWKIDDEQKFNLLAANESESDSYFKDDHPIIYDFTKEDTSNTNTNQQENIPLSLATNQQENPPLSPATNQLIHNNQNDFHATIPKYVPQKKNVRTLIPTPGWTPCDHMIHFIANDISSVQNELDSFESRCKRAHMDIEIVQRRIQSHQTNIPIEESHIHETNDPKVFPTNKEKKIERKYRCRSYKSHLPPNWEPRSYDSPEDMLNEKEVDIWTKLMKNELSKEVINNDAIDKGMKLKHIYIRSSENSSLEDSSSIIDN